MGLKKLFKNLFKSRNFSSYQNDEEISYEMDMEETEITDETQVNTDELKLKDAKNIVSLGFEDLLFPDGASTNKDKESLKELHNALDAFFDDQTRVMDVENCVKTIMARQVSDPSHDTSNPFRNAIIIGEKRAFCHYLMQLYDAFRFNTELNIINDVFASMLDFSSLSFIDKMTLFFLLTPRFQELPLRLYNQCLNTLSLVAYVTESPFGKMIEKKYLERELTPLSDNDLQEGADSYPRLEEIKRANIEKFLRERMQK